MSRVWFAVLFSIALHGLVLAAYCFLSNYEPPAKLDPPKIQVSLAKLGKPRDQTLLPKIDASQPPETLLPKPKSKLDSAHKVQPTKSKTASPLDLLKKRFGKPSDEGKEHGSKLGSSLSSELADSYELQILELLRSNYEIPRTISDREAKRLSLWVRMWIGASGSLIKVKIEQASKNPRFDHAVLSGSHKIHSFGAPPLQLARKYRTEGLLIQFCPLECS